MPRSRSVRVSVWALLSWMLLAVWLPSVVTPRSLQAQEAGAAAGTTKTEEKKSDNMLVWLVKTSGLIGLVILLISFTFVARVVMLFLELRPLVVSPPELMEQGEQLLAARDYQGIYRVARESNCALGEIIAAGMASLSSGLDEARESMDREIDAVSVHMEKRITLLAVIGSLGPMIGLLGTLKGMISSFSVIAYSGTNLKASEVAEGISEALVLTFEGVALSVPAIYFFAMFKDRIAALTVDIGKLADEFIRKVHATAGGKATV